MTSPSEPSSAADPCVLDVFEAARVGATCAGELAAARLVRLAASVESVDAPVAYRWTGTLDRRGDAGGRLDFEVRFSQRCDLCGSLFSQRVSVQRDFRFVVSEKALARRPIEPDDEIDWLVGSTHFDLADLIDEEAVLALPVSPRHPGCQAAVDAKARGASVTGAEPERPRPFAALARLKSGPH